MGRREDPDRRVRLFPGPATGEGSNGVHLRGCRCGFEETGSQSAAPAVATLRLSDGVTFKSAAAVASSVRFETSKNPSSLLTSLLTMRALKPVTRAISGLESPFEIISRISLCLAVSAAAASGDGKPGAPASRARKYSALQTTKSGAKRPISSCPDAPRSRT
jgi:hypothetical protein